MIFSPHQLLEFIGPFITSLTDGTKTRAHTCIYMYPVVGSFCTMIKIKTIISLENHQENLKVDQFCTTFSSFFLFFFGFSSVFVSRLLVIISHMNSALGSLIEHITSFITYWD